MFFVDEATAEATRRACDEGGELAGVVESKRHFPLIRDYAKAAAACGSSRDGSGRQLRSPRRERRDLGVVLGFLETT
jgi:hypothetical protein